jgi:hypothetical protein
VPPVPKRKLLVVAVAVAFAIGAAAAIAVPMIEEGKERASEREARTAAVLDAARRRRLAREQRAHRARVHRPPGNTAGARQTLIAALERSITRDARGRVSRGQLEGRIQGTSCEPAPRAAGTKPEGRKEAYDCVAATGRFSGVASGTSGYPFRAIVDFGEFSYVWCKTNPVPGEHSVPDPRDVVELPRACLR